MPCSGDTPANGPEPSAYSGLTLNSFTSFSHPNLWTSTASAGSLWCTGSQRNRSRMCSWSAPHPQSLTGAQTCHLRLRPLKHRSQRNRSSSGVLNRVWGARYRGSKTCRALHETKEIHTAKARPKLTQNVLAKLGHAQMLYFLRWVHKRATALYVLFFFSSGELYTSPHQSSTPLRRRVQRCSSARIAHGSDGEGGLLSPLRAPNAKLSLLSAVISGAGLPSPYRWLHCMLCAIPVCSL